MKTLARILVRDGKEAGLFIPMRGHGLKPGLYNLDEFLGEIEMKYVGMPVMAGGIANYSLDSLMDLRETALMTEAENKMASEQRFFAKTAPTP
jgi:hypothetical protein